MTLDKQPAPIGSADRGLWKRRGAAPMQEQQQVGFGSQILRSIQCNSKGRHHKRKVVFFQALPELAKKKNLPPIRATWSSFLQMSKTTFCAYDGIKYQ